VIRALYLIDGEHYPPVVEAGIDQLRAELEPVGAIYVGGSEKATRQPDLGVPIRSGDPLDLLVDAVEDLKPDLVVDLTDEPVTDPRRRFVVAGRALSLGLAYRSGGMSLEPVPMPDLTSLRAHSVIGTGKRTGKTAVTIELVRRWRARGMTPCIVTMGRGGPPDPVLLEHVDTSDVEALFGRLKRQGLHATSDYVEDALFAGVDTVGTRRLGAGPSGVSVTDSFAVGVAIAEARAPDMLIFEGSGTAIPPAAVDGTVLVTRSDIEPEFLSGYLGPYRLWMADVLVVVKVPGGRPDSIISLARSINPKLLCLEATLHPEPTVPVEGKRVGVVTTADPVAASEIAAELSSIGARSVQVITSLSDRHRLSADLARLRACDVVLTEIKAAAADVVIPGVRGLEHGFLHNSVRGELDAMIEVLDTKNRPKR